MSEGRLCKVVAWIIYDPEGRASLQSVGCERRGPHGRKHRFSFIEKAPRTQKEARHAK